MTTAPGRIRRNLLIAGGAGALAAGLAVGMWQLRAPADDAFWSLEFDTPDGRRLALASLRGLPTVMNFWATWCPPCVREIPALDQFAREFALQGWRVIGIAADRAEPVREFLTRTPVTFDVALAGFAGVELSRRLGNTSGGLPFTVIFDRRGRPAWRHIGETTLEALTAQAKGNQ
jgi:thiol-disulfide isomerase/thioredoxin